VRDARHLRPEAGLLDGLRDVVTVAGQDAFAASLSTTRASGRLAIIAEVKRMSPALGRIVADVDVERQVTVYAAAGAAAISVLTEPRFWGGSLEDLRVARASTNLPILCKDVIVDEYQILEARAAGADAVLLIAEILTDDELRRFIASAHLLHMGVLVEAHEAVAFGRAAASEATVVGVNARNLRRPEEIDIGRARQLHTFARPGQLLVAESGIRSADDARLLPARVDAVLVGTALMRAEDPTALLRDLVTIKRSARTEIAVVQP
jgi:indole-3-glycerol phosphate synthase